MFIMLFSHKVGSGYEQKPKIADIASTERYVLVSIAVFTLV